MDPVPPPEPPPGDGKFVLPDCAWQFKSNVARSNWALPNIGTVYWSYVYELEAGESLVLEGDFPGKPVDGETAWTRFFSFQTYNTHELPATDGFAAIPAASSVATMYDAGIPPTGGSYNPYVTVPSVSEGSSSPTGSYRVVISADAESDPDVPVAHDVLAAYPRPFGHKPYGTKGTLMLRYYLPADGYPLERDAPGTGGVGLPVIKHVDASGNETVISECRAIMRDAIADKAKPGAIETPPVDYQDGQPRFIRPAETDGVCPNAANRYLYAEATYDATADKRMIHIRGKMPSTPKTMPAPYDRRDGDVVLPGTDGFDMRYWSLIINKDAYPYPAVDSGGFQDADVELDENGFYTIIVSKPEDRPDWWENRLDPRNNGVNWVNWTDSLNIGPEDSIGLLMRNLVPSDEFVHSIDRVEPGSSPEEAAYQMEDYYPITRWVSKEDL